MKRYLNMSSIIMSLLIAIVISGCAAPLTIKYLPLENTDNHLASLSPVRIKLLPLVDKRINTKEEELIGKVKTGINVGIKDVKSSQPVLEILFDTMHAELTRNGHIVVNENEDIIMKGELKHFWLKTNVNSEDGHNLDDWDVIVEMKILLEAVNAGTGKSMIFGPYYAKNSEKRYLMPDDRTMTRVFEGALSKLMKRMNSDTELASALKK